jgi:hypothetical protein
MFWLISAALLVGFYGSMVRVDLLTNTVCRVGWTRRRGRVGRMLCGGMRRRSCHGYYFAMAQVQFEDFDGAECKILFG